MKVIIGLLMILFIFGEYNYIAENNLQNRSVCQNTNDYISHLWDKAKLTWRA